MLPNICLSGKSGVGKDWVANALVKHAGYEKLSTVAPLRVILYKHINKYMLLNLQNIDKHFEHTYKTCYGTIQDMLLKIKTPIEKKHPLLLSLITGIDIVYTNKPIVISGVRLDHERWIYEGLQCYLIDVINENNIIAEQPFDNLLPYRPILKLNNTNYQLTAEKLLSFLWELPFYRGNIKNFQLAILNNLYKDSSLYNKKYPDITENNKDTIKCYFNNILQELVSINFNG